jgi:hypothetical protein
VFLSFPVVLAIAEVPTKKFSFICTRHVHEHALHRLTLWLS